jgi:hypothetical protein
VLPKKPLVFSIPASRLKIQCILNPNLWSKIISRYKSFVMLLLIQINWLKAYMMLADLCTQN